LDTLCAIRSTSMHKGSTSNLFLCLFFFFVGFPYFFHLLIFANLVDINLTQMWCHRLVMPSFKLLDLDSKNYELMNMISNSKFGLKFHFFKFSLRVCAVRAFPTGLPKPKINSNIAHKSKKGLPTDELHARQNGFLLQLQAIYALYCSFAISFFYYFVSGILTPSLFLFFFFFLVLLHGCQSHGNHRVAPESTTK
jgi:hypothetical protein